MVQIGTSYGIGNVSVLGHDFTGQGTEVGTKWKITGEAKKDLGSNDDNCEFAGKTFVSAIFRCRKPAGPRGVTEEVRSRSTFRFFERPEVRQNEAAEKTGSKRKATDGQVDAIVAEMEDGAQTRAGAESKSSKREEGQEPGREEGRDAQMGDGIATTGSAAGRK